MQIVLNIRRAFFALFTVVFFIVAPAVSAMTPPACCPESSMAEMSTSNTGADSHCTDMAVQTQAPEHTADMCDSDCTGACCSIYVSVGLAFTGTDLPAEVFAVSHVRPTNDRSISASGRFPTPPPKQLFA